MAQRRSFQPSRRNHEPRPPIQVDTAKRAFVPAVAKAYGKSFIVLEDEQKKTFTFQGGSWVEYGYSIAECRVDGEVKQLAQKVNKMTRYEIRLPL